MNAYVFPDEALSRHAGRFVWLSVDTDKAQNAGFMEKYPVEAWPSLYVIDPKTGEVVLRWLGSATVPQLVKLLEDAERALAGGAEGAGALLARADRLYGKKRHRDAAAAYAKALGRAPADWERRPRAVESLLASQWGAKRPEACLATARKELPGMAPSASRLNAVVWGLSCALQLPEKAAERDEALRELLAAGEPMLADTSFEVAADDRSGLFITVREAKQALGDEEGAKRIAQAWSRFLDESAAKATTPEQRTVFDPHRMEAYLTLGTPERALPMLEASERDLPTDYNAPARLSYLHLKMGNLEEALRANDRALGKVEGPRRIRVLQTRADIFAAQGELPAARAALGDARRVHRALPKGQQNPKVLERLQAQLQKLRGHVKKTGKQ